MSLYLYLGCMFAGKTEALSRVIKLHLVRNKKCLLITYKNDIRYSEQADTLKSSMDKFEILCHENPILKTRETIKTSALTDIISCEKIEDIYELIINKPIKYDIIAIDEVQFYDDAVKYVKKFMKLGIKIYASGLDGNYKQEPFPVVGSLIPLAKKYEKLYAICMQCKDKKAIYTKKYKEEDTYKDEIGGSDQYYVVCSECS